MIFEQAYFGGIRTHRCIASSLNDETLLHELTGLTDKPHTLDKIEPYFSGARINSYYIFIKTIPVENAERGGIVFSHCIIAREEQIEKINNLKPIFQKLLSIPVLNKTELDKIKINEEELQLQHTEVNPLANKVFSELLNSNKPILLGYEVFSSVIFRLWNIIPAFLRQNFTFKLSGNENDLPESLPSLIYTPISNEVRWQNTKFVPVYINSEHYNLTQVENYLINNDENKFSSFMRQFQIKVNNLSDYRKIEKCYDYYIKWKERNDIHELNKTIRVVANIFPNNYSATNLKEELFHSFYSQIKNASSGLIISIRNIKFNSYENGFEQINSAMNSWLNSLTENYLDYPIGEIAELLYVYENESNPDWWNANIERFFKSTELLLDFHWQLWEHNPSFLYLSERFIELKEYDIFIKTKETSNKILIKELIDFSTNRKWFNIRAICSAKYFKTTKEAIENHLLISNNNYDSLTYLIDEIGNHKFFNYSTTISNVVLHKIAAEKAIFDSSLLNSPQIHNINWQSIWLFTLQSTNDLSYGIVDVQKIVFSFWDIVVSGQVYNTELVSFIANTKYSNVLEYPQRSILLETNIPDDIKFKILDTTCISLVKKGQKFDLDDFEDDLKLTLSNSSFVENTLGIQEISIKAKIIFLQNINALNEEFLIKLLLPNIRLVNSEEAIFLGAIINKYEWKRAIKLVRSYKRSNSNLNITWDICKHHYSWMDNLFGGTNSQNDESSNTFDLKPMDKKNKIFVSYSSNDRNLREIFKQRLSIYLKSTKNKFDDIWTDTEIPLGGDWNVVILDALKTSDIGILLVSPMFLGSDYSMGEELETMLKKKREEGYLIFPILLRDCNFHNYDILSSSQFFKTYKSEYEIYELLEKNKLMPFDELAEVDKPNERLLNRYFQKLANEIDRTVSI